MGDPGDGAFVFSHFPTEYFKEVNGVGCVCS